MYLLYDLLLLIAAIILVPVFFIKETLSRERSYCLKERFGFFNLQFFSRLKGKKIVWIHAASVGETHVALLLADRVKKDYPSHCIMLTNMTTTGLSVSQKSDLVDFSLLLPFDLSFTVERLFKLVHPQIIIIIETEIWPNFTRAAHKRDIPLIMVNGRLSDRSYPRYRALSFLLRPILNNFSAFCMQSQEDMKRIHALGAADGRIENTGNLKFDHSLPEVTATEVSERKSRYRIPEQVAVFVAGSTHGGEEKQLIEAYKSIASKLEKKLFLVLIPRYPERKDELQKMLSEAGVESRLRSSLQSTDRLFKAGEVLVVDSLGEVLDLYSIADLVFVGGSLVPVGGHNMLEGAILAKPVLFGPHVRNFKEISTKLIRAGGGVKVSGLAELEKQGVLILNDSIRSRAMGEAGRTLILENSGSIERTMRHIAKHIKE